MFFALLCLRARDELGIHELPNATACDVGSDNVVIALILRFAADLDVSGMTVRVSSCEYACSFVRHWVTSLRRTRYNVCAVFKKREQGHFIIF